MPITLKDVATRAGVSHQAVSAVLNGKTNCRVSEETRQRILGCVREMGYAPNISARWLKSRKTRVITVVAYPALRTLELFSMEFHPPFLGAESLQQLSQAISSRGYAMKLEYAYPTADLSKQAQNLLNPNLTDGIIFYGYHGSDFNAVLQKVGLPHLFFGHYIDIERHDVPLLGISRRPGVRAALRALQEAGRTKIAYCGIAANPTLPILREELELLGLYAPERMHLLHDYYDLRRLIERFQPGDFDAVVCSNDVVANWIFRECAYRGIAVPEDLAVVGYDNDPTYDFISTIGLDGGAFHGRAVELLVNAIEQPESTRIREIFQAEYYPRKTTP